jgi:hypothetical protein
MTLPSWAAVKTALRTRGWALAQLSAPQCGFQGPIGPMAYYFPALAALDLGGNTLTGAVPSDLGQGAIKLTYLDLAGNKLRGAASGVGFCAATGVIPGVFASPSPLAPAIWHPSARQPAGRPGGSLLRPRRRQAQHPGPVRQPALRHAAIFLGLQRRRL